MKICIIGTGYVGLVTGACFADLGNSVICVDNDPRKINMLKKGDIPFFEPGLVEVVSRNMNNGRLVFSSSIQAGVKHGEVIFIAVGTPQREDGCADLSALETVSRSIAKNMDSYRLIIEKSTVPVETGVWVRKIIQTTLKKGVRFDVASNPEFLREGTAIDDFLHPDRIVVGVSSKRAEKTLLQLYEPLKAPILVTDISSAELIKHASNSFLATKISYINIIARICDKVNADVAKVAEGMGLDKRIGKDFLSAGIGFGGSCFPKDLAAFIAISEKMGIDFNILKAVQTANEDQTRYFVSVLKQKIGMFENKTFGVLGLSFKPNTDDMRSAPSIDIIQYLREEGAKVKAFDPQAMEKARELLSHVTYCENPYEVARGADALLIITEWNEFKELDLQRLKKVMKKPLIFDGRNMYDPFIMKKKGFYYYSIGTPKVEKY
jgi:UDPglucose 6-dehydrogenase